MKKTRVLIKVICWAAHALRNLLYIILHCSKHYSICKTQREMDWTCPSVLSLKLFRAFWYAGQAVPEGSAWESRLIQPHANAIPFFVTFRVQIQLHEQILTSQKYQKLLRGGRPLSMFSSLEESHGAPAEGGSGNAEQEPLAGSGGEKLLSPTGTMHQWERDQSNPQTPVKASPPSVSDSPQPRCAIRNHSVVCLLYQWLIFH